MENLVRATLAGIANGGFAAAVVKANGLALQALVELNCYAIETVCVMTKASWKYIYIMEGASEAADGVRLRRRR